MIMIVTVHMHIQLTQNSREGDQLCFVNSQYHLLYVVMTEDKISINLMLVLFFWTPLTGHLLLLSHIINHMAQISNEEISIRQSIPKVQMHTVHTCYDICYFCRSQYGYLCVYNNKNLKLFVILIISLMKAELWPM